MQCKCFQDSNTRQLVFKTEELIAWLTQFFTLLPGDVILTGTPPGVGVFMKPPQFLKVCQKLDITYLLLEMYYRKHDIGVYLKQLIFSFLEGGCGGVQD